MKQSGLVSSKVLIYSACIKTFFCLLTSSFNIQKTLRQFPAICRFTLACALFRVVYKLSWKTLTWIKDRLRMQAASKQQHRDIEMFIACGLASFSFLVATPSDQSIFKLILFSRSFIATLHLLGELGILRPFQGSSDPRRITTETLLTILSNWLVAFAYYGLVEAMPMSMQKMVTRSSGMTIHEQRFCEAFRAVREIRKMSPLVLD